MKQRDSVSVFGQADPTDGRPRFDWKSKYDDPTARREIRLEALYLGILLFLMPTLMVILWLEYPKGIFHLSDQKYAPIRKYAFAWLAGTLGGVLFDLKWLYHTVARGYWNLDRSYKALAS